MAAITRTVPAECTAYTLGNSEIGVKGNQVSLPDGSWTFDVSDITTDNVRNVLGENTDDVYLLCVSNKINTNALFRPTYGNPLGVDLSEFAGYNHHAKPSTYFFNPLTWYTSIKNASGIGTIGFSLVKGERPPTMNNSANDWTRIKVKITYGDSGGEKTAWSNMAAISGTFLVDISDGGDPNRYTGCNARAYYCDVNGNPGDEIEGGAHGTFMMDLEVYYYSYSIIQGNQLTARHYYPYYDGGNKYDLYVESSDIGYNNISNPTKAIYVARPPYTKTNSKGMVCPYGFSIFQSGGVYWMYNLNSGDQRSIGSKFKENGTWYEVKNVYASGAKETLTSFTKTSGYW